MDKKGTKTVWIWLQGALTVVGGWIGWFLGGFDGLIHALITFVVIDYITGCCCAIVEKKLSSAIGLRARQFDFWEKMSLCELCQYVE